MVNYKSKTCRLSTMLFLTSSFFLVEIIVGYVTNSIALVADSFHMLSDVVALIVGFASVRISKWPSKRNTYGWVRAEILGALVNAVFLLALCFSILVEALKRLVEVEKVDNPKLLLIVGGAGLLVNLIGLCLFGSHGHSHGGHGHSHGKAGHSHNKTGSSDHSHRDLANGRSTSAVESERLVGHNFDGMPGSTVDTQKSETNQDNNVFTASSDHKFYISSGTNITIDFKTPELPTSNQLNMRGVFLHVLGDALGSVVVIVSALFIWFAEGDWKYYIDPAMSVIMVIIILSTTIPLLKESAFILLQTVPSHVNVENIIKQLEQMEGIYGVHECHIWQLAGNRIVASAHIRCHGIEEYMELASKIKHVFHNAGIHSTTIQPEFIDWQETLWANQPCALVCHSDGQLCTKNTCCGDKDSQQPSSGDGAALDQNNSNAANSLPNAVADPTQHQLVTKGQHGMSSAHSLDIKFSPYGDEVVLEMSEMAPKDTDKEDTAK